MRANICVLVTLTKSDAIKKYINIVNAVTTHFYIYIFIFHLCPYLHDGSTFCLFLPSSPHSRVCLCELCQFLAFQNCSLNVNVESLNGETSLTQNHTFEYCGSMKFIRQVNDSVQSSRMHISRTHIFSSLWLFEHRIVYFVIYDSLFM